MRVLICILLFKQTGECLHLCILYTYIYIYIDVYLHVYALMHTHTCAGIYMVHIRTSTSYLVIQIHRYTYVCVRMTSWSMR